MGRFPQTGDGRGSLKWIQRLANDPGRPADNAVLTRIPRAREIEWLSPLAADDFAEYRDAAFLKLLGLSQHSDALASFWPALGPQWDALGRTDRGDLLLVEAKAHIAEICSSGSKAGEASLARIRTALEVTAGALGSKPLAPWHIAFYQLANRLAHLQFLRSLGVPAWLVLVNFVGDEEMRGPSSEEAWRCAYEVAWHVMGLPRRHALSRNIVEVFPDVREWSLRT